MARVLVTDGDQRAALAVVRSLGRAGHTVFVCSSRPRSLAGASRHAHGERAVPDPLRDAAPFVDGVGRLVREWAIDTLIPVSEASALAVLPERHAFPHVVVPMPPAAVFRRICDKAAVARAAEAAGIATPAGRRLASPADRAGLDPAMLRFPLVVKSSRSVVETGHGRAKSAVHYAGDPAALAAVLKTLPAAAYPVLVQERIRGPGIGVFLFLWDGELLAAFAHRRLREKPPSGGVSVYRESIALDTGLLERSRALLEAFDWQGVAMVEYKLDARTDTPYLMEVNGRFWGSLQLAIDAGVDFPALLVAAAAGRRPLPVLEYRVGVRSRWWWGDVDHLLARLGRSPDELSLEPGAPGRARVVLDFLASCGPRSRGEVLRLDDPLPALRETLDWLHGR